MRAKAFFLASILLLLFSRPCQAGDGFLTSEELANATYLGTEEGPVSLVNGRWEGEPYEEGGAARPSVGLADDFQLSGDLNGDGADEAVVLLWQSAGGSGTFNYVAAVEKLNSEIRNLATAPLGDRVQVRSGSINGGVINLDVVQQ
jgi:hypothetical protein